MGAGQIGAGYDRPGPAPPLTYAHAIAKNPAFDLVGFVDPLPEQGHLAVARWGGKWFPSLQAAWRESPIDVVCVAVPDHVHYQVLTELAAFSLKIVLAEKPFSRDPDHAREILSLYQQREIPLLINYSRRHVPAFASLAQAIRAGQHGALLQGVGYYGKGSVHNGSHLVNLLLYLFGDLTFAQRIGVIVDYHKEDPTASVLLRATPPQSPIALHAVDSRLVSIFELDLLFSQQRIKMTNSGRRLEFYELKENPDFPGYCEYSLVRREETGLLGALTHFLELAKHVLDGGPAPETDQLDAVRTLEICREFIA